jgi:hypothetical protein
VLGGVTQIQIENSRKIKVFISSLEEELACEREFAARAIEGIYLEPEVIVEPIKSEEFFATCPPKEYLHQLRGSDLVILILWKGISTPVKEEIDEAKRLGKHVLTFVKDTGKERRSKELIKTIENLKSHVHYARFKKMREFEGIVRESVKNEINRLFFSAPKPFDTVRNIYEYATKIISRTQSELYTVERTPLLLLGPHKNVPEQERLYQVLEDWIDKQVLSRGSKGRLYSLYSVEQMKEKIGQMKKIGQSDLLDDVKRRLQNCWELQKRTKGRFKIHSLRGWVNPFIVGDDEFGLWFMIGKAQLGISLENKEISEKYKNEIEKLTQEQKSLNTMLEELGLA